MEPEIIRMYSSSPPPLDNVADDDEEDEFGEFGGFSEVSNSGIGFADFGAVNYPREGFIQSNHFMPVHEFSDNVNNITSLNSINDKENFSEHPVSKKGSSSVLETNFNNDTVQFNVAALENKGSSGEKAKKIDKHINSESGFTYLDNKDLNRESQELSIGTCNGEKSHCLEKLTNGFSVEESVNPQGKEDLDSLSDSKGFKTVHAHNSDLNIDFSPSPSDDFANFATFSETGSVLLEDTEQKTHNGLYEGLNTSIKATSTLNRVGEDSICRKRVPTDLVPEKSDEPNDDVLQNCTSETNIVLDSVEPLKNVSPTPENNISTSVLVQSSDIDRHAEDHAHTGDKHVEEMLHTTDGAGWSTDESVDTLEDAENLEHKCDNEIETGDGLSDSTYNDNLSKSVPPTLPSSDTFGDFNAASEEPPQSFTDQCEPNNVFKEKKELDVNELNDDFGKFEDTNIAGFQEELQPTSGERIEFQGSNKYSDAQPHEGFGFHSKVDDPSTFQETDEFADFSSAVNTNQTTDWNAFDDDDQVESTWAPFAEEKSDSSAPEADAWHSYRTEMPPSLGDQTIKTESVPLSSFHETGSTFISEGLPSASQQSLLSRLEQVIQVCFPLPPVIEEEENIITLDHFLKTKMCKETPESLSREVLNIWTELQDIHDAYGLKYQWGGSHSNKKLLCSLGIDTRNILFTGNKKQPVIVPMYAASLGMLEPTKEPLKPVSAAEKIASIGQSSPITSDDSICTSDQLQESLPPVQFDWSSSGLTNPLDGVDPELYELTTSKMECSSTSSKVTDAFARLMSTAETTSTSARKPRRDENLSDEAAKVISSLPDLSFMHAKVLMFPATLTPSTNSQDKSE
ncbi:aftiphilin isoform 2-T2 [Discoglossus pictus]